MVLFVELNKPLDGVGKIIFWVVCFERSSDSCFFKRRKQTRLNPIAVAIVVFLFEYNYGVVYLNREQRPMF